MSYQSAVPVTATFSDVGFQSHGDGAYAHCLASRTIFIFKPEVGFPAMMAPIAYSWPPAFRDAARLISSTLSTSNFRPSSHDPEESGAVFVRFNYYVNENLSHTITREQMFYIYYTY